MDATTTPAPGRGRRLPGTPRLRGLLAAVLAVALTASALVWLAGADDVRVVPAAAGQPDDPAGPAIAGGDHDGGPGTPDGADGADGAVGADGADGADGAPGRVTPVGASTRPSASARPSASTRPTASTRPSASTRPTESPRPSASPEPAPSARSTATSRPTARPTNPVRPPTSPTAAPTTPSAAPTSTAPARPVTGSAVVGAAGGTVRLAPEGRDAAVLTVPAGALAEPVRITLTATTGFTSSDLLGRALVGVDLQPSGLQFDRPATLDLRVPGGGTTQPLVAVRWQDDPSAATPVPWRRGPGGAARVDVPHFSGAGVGTPGIVGCPSVSTSHPEANQYKLLVGAYVQQLGAGADPATVTASLVATMHAWHDGAVAPFVAAADSVDELGDAGRRASQWEEMVQCLGLLDDEGLTAQRTASFTSLREATVALGDRYLLPTCTALASDIRDWVRVPLTLLAALQDLGEDPSPAMAAVLSPGASGPAHRPFCLRAVVQQLDAPEHVDADDRFVEVTFAARLEVVAQGGDVGATPQRIDLGPFAYGAVVTGGTVAGQEQLDGVTDAVGRRTLTIDRGADEDARTPQVGLHVDLARALPGAVPPGLPDPTDLERATRTSFTLDLRPEPALTAVLFPTLPGTVESGAALDVCVTVTDEVDDAVAGATVDLTFDGPGSPASAQATTVDNGVACAAWTSTEGLSEPATVTLRAVASRDGTTSPTVTRTITVTPAEDEDEEEEEPKPEPEPEPTFHRYAGSVVQTAPSSGSRTDASGTTVWTGSQTRRIDVDASNGYRGRAEWTVTDDRSMTKGSCSGVSSVRMSATADSFWISDFADGTSWLQAQVRGKSVSTSTLSGPPHCFPDQPRVTSDTVPVDWRMTFRMRRVLDDAGAIVRYEPMENGVTGGIDVRYP